MSCLRVALVAASLAGTTFFAAAAPLEDVDYIVIPAQPVAVPGKIEVIEFFYYGCDACNRLEAPLQAWLT
ncbi:MAG: thiol:disulfide interchange protein DsbA/DsbL, partial [Betaproteobacteria bacterium]